jgi:Mn2+/Fe2+ NRAMP family transporter
MPRARRPQHGLAVFDRDPSSVARRRPPVGRATAHRLHRIRRRRGRAGLAGLVAVLGPGLLAGLSDDDPAGITTYSILGADFGYALLWVLALSTAALIVFHELAARTGVVTGKGLVLLARERFGRRVTLVVITALVVANVGTLCAELAGVAVGVDLLTGAGRLVSVPLAAVVVSALVLRSGFHRVEHVLLTLSLVFVAYVVAGVLAHPDWGAAARGVVEPRVPESRAAVVICVATLGTTLAPWGLAFMQSYSVDKRLTVADLPDERVDVVTGALLTGFIGFFVVVACAATLHPAGIEIEDGADAAMALEPFAGPSASSLFGAGILGAALLAAAVVPLSTAYSVCEAAGHPAGLDERPSEAPLFYGSFLAAMAIAAAVVLVPAVPLVPVLYLTQVLNAVLLLAILPVMVRLGRDPAVLGEQRLGRVGLVACLGVIALTAVACGALVVLGILAR